jgi:hypothetical protein
MRNKDLAFKQSQDLPISGLSTQPWVPHSNICILTTTRYLPN